MSDLLHVTCPQCGKSGDLPVAFAGKGIHCKKCDAHFIVPHPAGAAAPADAHRSQHATHGHGHGASHAHTPAQPASAPGLDPSIMPVSRSVRAHGHELDPIPVVPEVETPAPAAHAHVVNDSILDHLDDDAGLAPLSDEDEAHARQRYEARVLSKERSAHYDDHGNQLTEDEYEERKRQGRSSVH